MTAVPDESDAEGPLPGAVNVTVIPLAGAPKASVMVTCRGREKAVATANAALHIAPKDPWVLADIAETYDRLGDRRRAIQYAQQSLKNGYTLSALQRRPALLGLLADPNFTPRGMR